MNKKWGEVGGVSPARCFSPAVSFPSRDFLAGYLKTHAAFSFQLLLNSVPAVTYRILDRLSNPNEIRACEQFKNFASTSKRALV